MPTIPLYDTSAPPDGYHRMIAPGGYEWWRFVARDPQLTIDFLDGDTFEVAYRSAYERYVARPTRVPPPVPRDHPAVRVTLIGGRVFGELVPKGAVRFAEKTLTIGNSSLAWRADGTLAITLKGLVTADRRATLEGELTFEGTGTPSGGAALCQAGRLSGVLRDSSTGSTQQINCDAEYTHSFGVQPFPIA